jgi:RNA polymerase sigma factor (TIGR02999 family)
MTEVSRILDAIRAGDAAAGEQLLPLVYEDLRRLAAHKMAAEAPGRTLQATALVHEAWLRLVGPEGDERWDSRGHFFAAAAEAMRRILINAARDRSRLKRGGGRARLDLEQLQLALDSPDEELLALDEALAKLAREEPQCAKLVELRFFAGLKHEDAAQALGLARRTADRYWAFARAWLYDELRRGAAG